MFTLFRRLRRNLLSTDRYAKYLLYALGEILLVVIGILLALQINNWNEERVLKKKERLYLKEIRQNLIDDLGDTRYILQFNKHKDSVIENCLQNILNTESNREAMIGISRNMPVLAEYNVLTQNRVAFDNMLSAQNIDLITSDTLRTALSSYYSERNLLEGTQERVKDLTRNFVDNISPMLMNREGIEQLSGVKNNFAPVTEVNFVTNSKLFADLFSMQRTLESHSRYMANYQVSITGLIALINEFLEPEN